MGASAQNNGKPRVVKVVFNSVLDVRRILKNNSSRTTPVLKNIRITDDKTPAQMAYLNKVRDELKRRIESGETYLTIKYTRGIPQTVTTNSTKTSLKFDIYGIFYLIH